jgi:hypothetical protein
MDRLAEKLVETCSINGVVDFRHGLKLAGSDVECSTAPADCR